MRGRREPTLISIVVPAFVPAVTTMIPVAMTLIIVVIATPVVVGRCGAVVHRRRRDVDRARRSDINRRWDDHRRRRNWNNGHHDPREVDADTHAHIGGIGRRGDEHSSHCGAEKES